MQSYTIHELPDVIMAAIAGELNNCQDLGTLRATSRRMKFIVELSLFFKFAKNPMLDYLHTLSAPVAYMYLVWYRATDQFKQLAAKDQQAMTVDEFLHFTFLTDDLKLVNADRLAQIISSQQNEIKTKLSTIYTEISGFLTQQTRDWFSNILKDDSTLSISSILELSATLSAELSKCSDIPSKQKEQYRQECQKISATAAMLVSLEIMLLAIRIEMKSDHLAMVLKNSPMNEDAEQKSLQLNDELKDLNGQLYDLLRHRNAKHYLNLQGIDLVVRPKKIDNASLANYHNVLSNLNLSYTNISNANLKKCYWVNSMVTNLFAANVSCFSSHLSAVMVKNSDFRFNTWLNTYAEKLNISNSNFSYSTFTGKRSSIGFRMLSNCAFYCVDFGSSFTVDLGFPTIIFNKSIYDAKLLKQVLTSIQKNTQTKQQLIHNGLFAAKNIVLALKQNTTMSVVDKIILIKRLRKEPLFKVGQFSVFNNGSSGQTGKMVLKEFYNNLKAVECETRERPTRRTM